MAAFALARSAAPARAQTQTFDFGCSDFGGVESAQACTALIEKGGRPPTGLAALDVLRASSIEVGRCWTWHSPILPRLSGCIQASCGVLELLHENERALEDYDYVILRAPGFVPGYVSRGEFFLRIGAFDRAKLDFDRAIALKPTAAEALFGRANALLRMGDLDDAISDYGRAIYLAPNRLDYQRARDDAYKAKGDAGLANADHDLQKRAQLAPAKKTELAQASEPGSLASPEARSLPPADDWTDCQPGAAAKVEAACTAVIENAERSPQDLASAHARRGDF